MSCFFELCSKFILSATLIVSFRPTLCSDRGILEEFVDYIDLKDIVTRPCRASMIRRRTTVDPSGRFVGNPVSYTCHVGRTAICKRGDHPCFVCGPRSECKCERAYCVVGAYELVDVYGISKASKANAMDIFKSLIKALCVSPGSYSFSKKMGFLGSQMLGSTRLEGGSALTDHLQYVAHFEKVNERWSLARRTWVATVVRSGSGKAEFKKRFKFGKAELKKRFKL